MNLIDDVTLLCVDTVDYKRGRDVVCKCLKVVGFKHISLSGGKTIPPEILKASDPLPKYSAFCLHHLYKYFNTSHCLIVQHDGWIVNSDAWRDEWLEYDYVGCQTVWTEPGEEGKGGNGGFSLRSRKLMELASLTAHDPHPEDMVLSCLPPRGIRNELEAAGCKFAPAKVQKIFGLERQPYSGQFGHHQGKF